MSDGKLIVFSAPSGAGKTSVVKAVLAQLPDLAFSVSACSRQRREGERDGIDYHFLSADAFRDKIEKGLFLEWEEVYPGSYYGTLLSEVERIWAQGNHVIFDVDVVGGLNIKARFPQQTLTIFVAPPSLEILAQRLRGRGTETEESINKRLGKAEWELEFAKKFDVVVVNNNLNDAIHEALLSITAFLAS